MSNASVKVFQFKVACKIAALRLLLSLLHVSGLARALAHKTRGRGVIFTLHSVDPSTPTAFDPNGILRVTPEFLEQAIETVLAEGYDIVTLDEAVRRLRAPVAERPFACFTFDDAYRDNRDYAYPLFKRFGVPMTIYAPAAYLDGKGDLWWFALENAIRAANSIDIEIAGSRFAFPTRTRVEKDYAFCLVYGALRALPESQMRAKVAEIAAAAGYDSSGLCRDLIMSWDELRALAADPLVNVAAHTVDHLAIAKLPHDEAGREIAASVRRVEAELGRPCRHFSFPYGDAASAGPRDFEIVRALGLESGVTTHKNVLHAAEGSALGGLPRVSLNGNFQKKRYVRVFLSGVPFAALAMAKRARSVLRRRKAAPSGAIAHAAR